MRIRFHLYRCLISSIALAGPASAVHGEEAAPPEVKKTVDAFIGHWTMSGTDMEPGARTPAPVKAIIDCRPAALGVAVYCLTKAEIAGTPIEAASVIGYSPEEHVVRWMEISSTGEYHDHRGRWKASAVVFEPLTYTVSGAKLTEYFTPSFPSTGKMSWSWSVETGQGTSHIELAGTRSGAGQ
jgi:hypothetical protein